MMTLAQFREQTRNLSGDCVLLDSNDQPVMYWVHIPEIKGRGPEGLRFGIRSQINIENQLRNLLDDYIDCSETDIDILQLALNVGFEIGDFKLLGVNEYEWAKRVAEEYELI